ncbi:MAG: glycosyltransferase [Bacteroides sp.]|nr:glycosyltransferase [Roseburia sp.]MCM1345496.1 glycosyltransferase [Bacteroides sp.]MCM1420005.1 glycosyltransferase [Bacteroides sp.]
MSKITVLTAVYNAEKYLRQCLDSLCAQTLKDIQIVCIDDCSTDGSLAILEEYADRDSRICVLRTERNAGQAVARNLGLERANGEYITMLDSDDWLALDALEKAYKAVRTVEDADCAVFRLMQCYEDTGMVELYENKTDKTVLDGEEAFRLSLDWSLHGLYIVRADIHKAYPYDTSCRLYSDDNTTRMHYLHSRKVVICDGEYFYRKYSASMTSACTILRFDYMDANLSMKRQLEEEMSKGNLRDAEYVLDFYENHRWLNIVGAYWFFYQNRQAFTSGECAEIERRIAANLRTVETWRIRRELKMKLGYYPFKSYTVFKRMENFYFRLRGCVWKIKKKRGWNS